MITHLLNILKLGVLPIQYLDLYCLFLVLMTLLITLNLSLDYLQLILSYSSYSYHTSYFETNINSDLVKINDWANTWLIKFNPNMFFFLLISNTLPRNNITMYMYCENSLDYIGIHRHLGITFIEL